MNLLAFDTSTEQLSVAVLAGAGGRVRGFEGPGGASASTTLLPAVQSLLADAGLALAELDAIAFGRGPGSFTGLRTACAVAQGLGFASGRPVLAVDTLSLVAEAARAQAGTTRVVAVLDARMGEVYAAACEWDGSRWRHHGAPVLCQPEEVVVPTGWALAGNALALYADRLPPATRHVEAGPTASAILRIAPALVAAGLAGPAARAAPLYVRDKVAQTTQERAADKARRDAAGTP